MQVARGFLCFFLLINETGIVYIRALLIKNCCSTFMEQIYIYAMNIFYSQQFSIEKNDVSKPVNLL